MLWDKLYWKLFIMNKFFLFSLLFLLLACESKNPEYEANLSTHKQLVTELNAFYSNPDSASLDISDFFTDDFLFYYFPAGSPKGVEASKSEYFEILQNLKNSGFVIKIGHSIYLPGIDEHTHKVDGSIRLYYGATVRKENSVALSAYRTINFENGKISGIWEWADYGGLTKQLYD
jgi:hypothetical protein